MEAIIMSTDKHGKSSKQGRQRKTGANLAYVNEGRQNKSHLRRITKHLQKFPDDAAAVKALADYKAKVGHRTR
jgi:hypothetical protein